jgi:hypothetical protein
MPVRIRIAELMKENRIESAYRLAQALEHAGADVSAPSVYRLVRADGALATYSAELLEALSTLFRVEIGDLFDGPRKGKRR